MSWELGPSRAVVLTVQVDGDSAISKLWSGAVLSIGGAGPSHNTEPIRVNLKNAAAFGLLPSLIIDFFTLHFGVVSLSPHGCAPVGLVMLCGNYVLGHVFACLFWCVL
ncbi:hypothetical protein TRVL_06638 [Trypanosoma vivax]|nr:hypothetical protein TRVL_06638 [Trypanosoma vivax]